VQTGPGQHEVGLHSLPAAQSLEVVHGATATHTPGTPQKIPPSVSS
jgi:hypothetical protein